MPTFAAVDIGANSVRLKISNLVNHRLSAVHQDREVTRLGEAVFRTGALDPAAIALTVKVLSRFYKAVQTYGAQSVRVVATSALRDASNASAFTAWVHAATGWRVETITGLEEGRLIHLGVISGMRLPLERMLLIDLGGGSCELTVSLHGQIESIYSLPLGAVRLTRVFLQHDPAKKRELQQLKGFIEEEIGRVERELASARVQMTVATSGTASALAEMWAAKAKKRTTVVPRETLVKLARQLGKMDIAQRRALKGIGPRRAEIITAGAAAFAELLSRLHLPNFRYSPLGLCDGILAQLASEYDISSSVRKRIESERENTLDRMTKQYHVDLRFAARVREHAAALFKELRPVHQLPDEYADWLAAACMLQEIGSFINRTGRRRHTYYAIAHSEMFGYTVRQRLIIAAIARYISASPPLSGGKPVRVLAASDRPLVAKAVGLLRLARALEQGRRGTVTGIRVRVGPRRVVLLLNAKRPGADLELWALNNERPYFREVFGRELAAFESD
ncbi:MAG: Ppx/GppA phosphatase family protein [Candidatus Korobacteraceae bacterium]